MPTEPTGTYRVQLHAGFTLDDAVAILPRLVDLGVSHLYCSPYLASAPGSTHGYDVVDHSRVDDEAGGDAARERLVAALGAHGLGHVLDIVPNHMAVGVRANSAWWDLLRHGRQSRYATWFDVDWSRHGGRVLVPVLGEPLDVVLSRGELKVDADPDGPVLRYYDHVFPLADGTADSGVVGQELLDRQHYLLAHWRETPRALNYRRFFDVTTLAGLRVEDDEVFAETHARVLGWVADGSLDGIRVDHPDGLTDPAAYLGRLAERAPGAWVVVEKILEPGEALPPWPVAGTTGYDALALVQQVLLDASAEQAMTDLYGEVTGAETDYAAVVREAKDHVLREVLVPEVDRLVGLVEDAATEHRVTASRDEIGDTVRALLAAFPVYRTYTSYAEGAGHADLTHVRDAVDAARQAPGVHEPTLDLLAAVLRADPATRTATTEHLLARWQQTTGPVMAKGVEDTTFYRYHRLTALNEVGSDPGVFGVSPTDFHAECVAAQRDWPLRMTTLSTHDTKRSEDVRARLLALAEMPDRWGRLVRTWFDRYADRLGDDRDDGVDRNTAYLLFQTLVGAYPLPVDRAVPYLEKAAREAKQRTSWTDPDPAYESALRDLVTASATDEHTLRELADLMAEVEPAARVVSLAQKLVQLTMPGVPDVYQGSELWDHSLVDPDNRRPVDHALRERLACDVASLGAAQILARAEEGLPKLHVVRAALRLRRERPEAFGAAGSYTPLSASGARAAHCLAFIRGGEVVTVVPRLPLRLAGDWSGTTLALPPGDWTNVLTGARVAGGGHLVGDLFADFPVALLARSRDGATGG